MVMQQIHWNTTDRASQALVDAMIEDIGIEDERIKKASRTWALSLLEDDFDMEMADWEHSTGCFAEGYAQALKDMENR